MSPPAGLALSLLMLLNCGLQQRLSCELQHIWDKEHLKAFLLFFHLLCPGRERILKLFLLLTVLLVLLLTSWKGMKNGRRYREGQSLSKNNIFSWVVAKALLFNLKVTPFSFPLLVTLPGGRQSSDPEIQGMGNRHFINRESSLLFSASSRPTPWSLGTFSVNAWWFRALVWETFFSQEWLWEQWTTILCHEIGEKVMGWVLIPCKVM